MFKFKVTHYSIANGAIESRSSQEYDTLDEIAAITQERINLYFDYSHPRYAMHTPTDKEIIYYTPCDDRMGDLVELRDVTLIIMKYKKYIERGKAFKIVVQYYDTLSEKHTQLAVFEIST